MNNLYARAVFFVENTERARTFYIDKLGFSPDWGDPEEDGVRYVCQVSLMGFEVILNQVHDKTIGQQGHGRVYIGLEDEQIKPVLDHIKAKGIPTERIEWGRPTLVVRDLDGNEIFFWDWPDKHADLGVNQSKHKVL